MGTLTLGLNLRGVASKPHDQALAATVGLDVVVSSGGFAEPEEGRCRFLPPVLLP
jgi:hypothetical protein